METIDQNRAKYSGILVAWLGIQAEESRTDEVDMRLYSTHEKMLKYIEDFAKE